MYKTQCSGKALKYRELNKMGEQRSRESPDGEPQERQSRGGSRKNQSSSLEVHKHQ